MNRLLCSRCGDSIHPDTAAHNNGLCLPCVRGNHLSIQERVEKRRKDREAEQARFSSPEHKYWANLVNRVHDHPAGFNALTQGDRLYYLVNVLGGEVHNGGFDQFFTNSSGDRYSETVVALKEVGAKRSLALLLDAKLILFPNNEVPSDRMTRCEMMPTWEEDHPNFSAAIAALDELDKQFYANQDELSQVLDFLAVTHKLYAGDS